MSWAYLDVQMKAYSERLVREVRLEPEMAVKLATTIAADVRFLTNEQKEEIRAVTPIPLEDRIEELKAFQNWADQARKIEGNPSVTRAHVLTQNYICFVYLPESCFRALSKVCMPGSAAKKCAQFLSNNPIRAFRNAIAHSNWTYKKDFGGIIYWASKGDKPEQLERFEVEQKDLNFWQALSRCVAYTAFSNL